MNTVTRNIGEIKMEYRPASNTVTFRTLPQAPAIGMSLLEAIAAAKATLALAQQRLSELSDDSLYTDEAGQLQRALSWDITLDMDEDEYVDYLNSLRLDGAHEYETSHFGQD